MNGNPTIHDDQATSRRHEPLVKWAARVSPAAPLVAWGFTALAPESQTRVGKLVGGGIGVLIVVAGFILALVALRSVRKYGREGIRRPAIAGLAINGAVILLSIVDMATLLPVLGRLGRMQNAGYTRAEMEAMPETIPGSRKVLDETIGFRIEIPREFTDAPEAPMPNTLYSFVRPSMLEPSLVITVRQLGGRLLEPAPPDMDALRREFPSDCRLELSVSSWKTYSLDIVTVYYPAEDMPMCLHFAVVPLCREAIQVIVTGPAARESDSRVLLSTLLANLKGLTYADSVSLARQEKSASES